MLEHVCQKKVYLIYNDKCVDSECLWSHVQDLTKKLSSERLKKKKKERKKQVALAVAKWVVEPHHSL